VLLLNTISVEFDLPTPAHRPKPIDHDWVGARICADLVV
jgi:hypothetical protein